MIRINYNSINGDILREEKKTYKADGWIQGRSHRESTVYYEIL